jgi:4-hydroxythreonine-4-phosphate dehydrogenase
MTALPRLAVTLGEPAGIGPELAVRLAHSDVPADLVMIGDAALIEASAQRLHQPLAIAPYDADVRLTHRPPGHVRMLHQPLATTPTPGTIDPANSPAVLATLARAADGCLSREFDAVMTLPVHKGVINDAGIRFSGHTEFFAERSDSGVLMLLVAGDLRVALATTHLPLRGVADAISPPRLTARLRLLDAGLRRDFGLPAPRIAVLGLNPHAGEGGHLGREEIDIISPTLERLRAEGIAVDGPLSADTAFVPSRRAGYDAYFAMYHDQGLPVLKALGFGAAVNVSLGLPFVRTSVDHGVALDLAGKGRADAGSAIAAAGLALQMAARRHA